MYSACPSYSIVYSFIVMYISSYLFYYCRDIWNSKPVIRLRESAENYKEIVDLLERRPKVSAC